MHADRNNYETMSFKVPCITLSPLAQTKSHKAIVVWQFMLQVGRPFMRIQ